MASKGLDPTGNTVYLDDQAFTGDVELLAASSGTRYVVLGWSLTLSGGAGAAQVGFRDGPSGERFASARIAQNVPWVVGNAFVPTTSGNALTLCGGLAATTVSGFVRFERR